MSQRGLDFDQSSPVAPTAAQGKLIDTEYVQACERRGVGQDTDQPISVIRLAAHANRPDSRAVHLCVAAVGSNVRICRRQGFWP